MSNMHKNNFPIKNNNFFLNNLTLISYIYRILEETNSTNTQTTTVKDNKKQQLRELYIYIAVLAGIIIIILIGYALYRKCVEKKVIAALELEYQQMIYNILNSMSSHASSSIENSQPRSDNRNQNYYDNFDMRSDNAISENDYHEERMENIRKKYGNGLMIKCLLKKQVETIEYDKKLEETFGDKCTICMDEFQIGVKIYKTPCEHIFHINCFDKYLKGINKKDKLICPNCNQNLLINKKFMKLRTKKVEVNRRSNNKDDNAKEIIINNSDSNLENGQEKIDKQKEKERERAEIIYIKKITKNMKKEIKDNIEENIYNHIKIGKSEIIGKKDDLGNKSKKNTMLFNNELKKSSDSKGILLYSRNSPNPNSNRINKINSERQDILTKDIKEEEKQ